VAADAIGDAFAELREVTSNPLRPASHRQGRHRVDGDRRIDLAGISIPHLTNSFSR
jgi:hypothetical protein